jgi:hypothetical protein
VNTINLYEYALARARESVARRELAKVAKASGLDYSWLSKFARGVIPGASYKMVDQLATYYMSQVPPPTSLDQGRAAA